jgi:hypothetical protein
MFGDTHMKNSSQSFIKSPALISLILAALCLNFTGCSSSSSGGGGGANPPANKPDLNAAIAVGQSFSVVKNAGQPGQAVNAGNQKLMRSMVLSANSPAKADSNSLPPPDQKVRAQELKKMISNPQNCVVQFESAQSPQPSFEMSSMGMGFSLKISGPNCPISADFTQSMEMTQQSAKIVLDYGFKVQNLVGASDAEFHGGFNINVSSDGKSQSGDGQIKGRVNSAKYGMVNMQMDLKLEANQESSAMTEQMSFQFPDATKNLVITRVTTQSQKIGKSVICNANGVEITTAECDQVLEGVTNEQSSSGSTDTGSEVPPNQPTPIPPSSGDESLKSWQGKSLEIVVHSPQVVKSVTATNFNAEKVLMEGRVIRGEEAESKVLATRPACFVAGAFGQGTQPVTMVSNQSQEQMHLMTITLGNGAQIICLTKDQPLTSAALLRRTFTGVVVFKVR